MQDAHRQVIDAVKAAVTGLPSTGLRVFEQPPHTIPSEAGDLPALVVMGRDLGREEWSGPMLGSEGEIDRHTLGVEVVSVAHTPEARDQSGLEVKVALLQSAAPIGDRRWFSRAAFAESGEGDRPLYALVQRFEFVYRVHSSAPDQIVS